MCACPFQQSEVIRNKDPTLPWLFKNYFLIESLLTAPVSCWHSVSFFLLECQKKNNFQVVGVLRGKIGFKLYMFCSVCIELGCQFQQYTKPWKGILQRLVNFQFISVSVIFTRGLIWVVTTLVFISYSLLVLRKSSTTHLKL